MRLARILRGCQRGSRGGGTCSYRAASHRGDRSSSGSAPASTSQAPIGAFVAEMDFGVATPIGSALHEAVDAERFGYLTSAMVDSE